MMNIATRRARSLSPDSPPEGESDEASLRDVHAKPPTQRMFFALWPSAVVAADLAKVGGGLHEVCGGRRTRAETIHLTLVFLGEVQVERIDDLLTLAGQVRTHSFSLNLTRLGWWPHNRIVWAAPDRVPNELAYLVDSLRHHLESAGVNFDAKPFVPHITLLRKGGCKDKLLPDAHVEWRIEDFVLVRSVPGEGGAAYEEVGRWQLF